MKKSYQPYYSHQGRRTKEYQAESHRLECQVFQGSGFLEIPHNSDSRLNSIKSTKSAPPELVLTESKESEDEVRLEIQNEVNDIQI